MCFNNPNDNVFAAGMATNRFAQHLICFPDAGRVTEKQLENAFRFLGRSSYFEPLFGCSRHALFCSNLHLRARIECCGALIAAETSSPIRGGPRANRLHHLFYRKVLPVNATTVALTLILAILVVSTFWGMTVSVPLSVVAMFAFNYFFLPPVGRLTWLILRTGWRYSHFWPSP